jgi:hypothetical protein
LILTSWGWMYSTGTQSEYDISEAGWEVTDLDQNGGSVSLGELEGQFWLADIYCLSECLPYYDSKYERDSRLCHRK